MQAALGRDVLRRQLDATRALKRSSALAVCASVLALPLDSCHARELSCDLESLAMCLLVEKFQQDRIVE
jgi:hypothetical protein